MNTEIAYAFAWYFVFIVSATVHEAAHAWAAKRGGDPTAYEGGQVSLNPWPHIKRAPIGMVIIPIISIFLIHWPFGFASTPIDPIWAYQNPRKSAWVSLAGPVANLVLVTICFIVMQIGIFSGFFAGPNSVNLRQIVISGSGGVLSGLALLVSMMFTMNVILFILNLIPLPPLDGSGVIALFLNEDSARKYHSVISNPAFGFVGLLLARQVFNPIFQALFTKIVNVIYWSVDYYYGAIFTILHLS